MTLKEKKEEEKKKEEEEITVYSLSHSVVIYSETDSDEMSQEVINVHHTVFFH